MNKIRKTAHLFKLLFSNRSEFADHAAAILEARSSAPPGNRGYYEPLAWDDALTRLKGKLGPEFETYLRDEALKTFEAELQDRLPVDLPDRAIPKRYDADRTLARLCYAVCRLKRPSCVVETGVSRGITSAYILQALQVNNKGHLVSIDLPPLAADPLRDVGVAVPERLRDRWSLHIGASKRLLPRLLDLRGPADMFIHDSLHTYRTMKREFETVAAYLSEGSVLVADDVESNLAFREWMATRKFDDVFTVKTPEKPWALFGVSLL